MKLLSILLLVCIPTCICAQDKVSTEEVKYDDNHTIQVYKASYVDSLKHFQPKRCASKSKLATLVPQGFSYEGILLENDFDGDGREDCMLSVLATRPEYYYKDDDGKPHDCNRNGYILAMNRVDHYEVTSFNYECFLPGESICFEDISYPFWLDGVSFWKGVLTLHFFGALGSGMRTEDYELRYENGDFILLKHISGSMLGENGVTSYSQSYDFENGNLHISNLDNYDGVRWGDADVKPMYKEENKNIPKTRQIKLSEIVELPN